LDGYLLNICGLYAQGNGTGGEAKRKVVAMDILNSSESDRLHEWWWYWTRQAGRGPTARTRLDSTSGWRRNYRRNGHAQFRINLFEYESVLKVICCARRPLLVNTHEISGYSSVSVYRASNTSDRIEKQPGWIADQSFIVQLGKPLSLELQGRDEREQEAGC